MTDNLVRMATAKWCVDSHSAAETERCGERWAGCLEGGEVLGLSGELGSGKTVLIRGLAQGLGVPPDVISSPTFVLVQSYQGRLRLIHADLYRLESAADVQHLGLFEELDHTTVMALEWAERAEYHLPADRLEIDLSHVGPTRRVITVRSTGPRSFRLLSRVIDMERKAQRSASHD